MMKIALVGDIFITRPLPEKGYNGLPELTELIKEHEVRFANLETTVHRREGYPSAFPGGTWAMTNPICLKTIKQLGFNVLNTANNHSMDYSHKGLLATHRHLTGNDLHFAGTGENLADATAPVFIECSDGRVAILGATSSFHDSDAAGNQHIAMNGRPGVNPLRHKSIYELTEENFNKLQQIANDININEYHNQAIREGYLLPKDNLSFGNFEFKKGNINKLHTYPIEKDLVRITKAVSEAKKQSDCVIVSIHSHQFVNENKQNPAEFIQIFAKSCIDAGASVIVGHGPHVLRGIEVYNKGIIFYGLGNFIFQNETVSHLPADFYEKYSLQYDDGVSTAMDTRSKNGTIGLNIDKDAWNTILVSLDYDSAFINVKLYPIELGFELDRHKKGFPRISKNGHIMEQIKELSTRFSTDIKNINGIGSIIIKRE